jgi:hypothetical protein
MPSSLKCKIGQKNTIVGTKLSQFKIQSLGLAKSDVCVTVNVCRVYDKNLTAQNLEVSLKQ